MAALVNVISTRQIMAEEADEPAKILCKGRGSRGHLVPVTEFEPGKKTCIECTASKSK
jgi:hypothetical protein